MSDLVEFLLTRIAEDYADAMSGWRWKSLPTGEYERLQARVLAECEAKKAIVEAFVEADAGFGHPSGMVYPEDVDNVAGLRIATEHLAAVYADHPDFDEAWRP